MKKSISILGILVLHLSFSFSVFAQKSFPKIFEEYDKSEVVIKADKKLTANDIAGALKILDDAVAKQQDLFEVYRKRSFIRRYYIDDIDGAISDLNKVIEIKPDDAHSYYSLGFLLQAFKKDYIGALRVYEAGQKHQPDSVEILTQKAFVKLNLKDFDGAVSEMQAAIKIEPDSVALQVDMSDLLARGKKPEQASNQLQTFLDNYIQKRNGVLPKLKGEKVKKDKIVRNPDGSIDGKSPAPVRRYSKMEFSANSPDELKKQLDEIENTRNLAKAYIALGKLYVAENNFGKAFVSLDTALEIDKNQEEAYGLRGIVYLSRGENEKAIIELTKAADIADEPYFYLNRGIAYLLTKDNKKAQTDFDYFLKLYPDGKPVLDRRIAEIKQQPK